MKIYTVRSNRSVLNVVAAVCLGCAALGAHAGDSTGDVPTRKVHYADLNLNTPTGAATLYRRIEQAAVQVCDFNESRDLAKVAMVKACIDRAMEQSVKAVNIPQLTRVYNARIGNPQHLIQVAGQ